MSAIYKDVVASDIPDELPLIRPPFVRLVLKSATNKVVAVALVNVAFVPEISVPEIVGAFKVPVTARLVAVALVNVANVATRLSVFVVVALVVEALITWKLAVLPQSVATKAWRIEANTADRPVVVVVPVTDKFVAVALVKVALVATRLSVKVLSAFKLLIVDDAAVVVEKVAVA